MKKLLLILICLPIIGFGQGWVRGYIDAYAYSVDQTNDGGYIVAGGISTPNNQSDIWLLKTDGQGIQQWINTFSTNERDLCYAVKQTADGCYILSGHIGETDTSDGEFWVSKVDSFGQQIWSNSYNDANSSFSIEQTNDGSFVFAGTGGNIYKADNNGHLIWSHSYHIDFETIYYITKTLDGGFIISGLDTMLKACIMKTDSLGVKEWKKVYGSNNTDWEQISSVQEISGGFVLVGEQEFISGSNTGYNNIWLIKTNLSGDTLWEKSIVLASYPFISARSIQQTTDGGFIISGFLISNQNDYDIFLLKTNANGVEQWQKTFGGSGMDASFAVRQTFDGGYVIAGFSETHTLIKTDGNGNITSTFNISSINNSNGQLLKVTDLIGRETKGKKNEPLFYIYDDGTVEKKIIIE